MNPEKVRNIIGITNMNCLSSAGPAGRKIYYLYEFI